MRLSLLAFGAMQQTQKIERQLRLLHQCAPEWQISATNRATVAPRNA